MEVTKPEPQGRKLSGRNLLVAFLFLVVMVDVILSTVIAVGILTTAGEGVVAEKHFKFKGTPSIEFATGEIMPAVGAYYSIEKGDRVKKERWSLTYEINGKRVNAWFLYVFALIRFSLPGLIVPVLMVILSERFILRNRPPVIKDNAGSSEPK